MRNIDRIGRNIYIKILIILVTVLFFRQWVDDSYSFYTNLLNNTDEPLGINKVSGYMFSSKDPSLITVITIVINLYILNGRY